VFQSAAPRDGALKDQSRALLRAIRDAMSQASSSDIKSTEWAAARGNLEHMSQANAQAGASPTETATWIFSLRQPILLRVIDEFKADPAELALQSVNLTNIIDKLGLFTAERSNKKAVKTLLPGSSRRCWSCQRRLWSYGRASWLFL
jgi:hypothetical protein